MEDPGEFVEDISIAGMRYALTIRSPIARGKLESLEFPKLPGLYYLITAKNIPGRNELADFHVPVLADEELSYIGQPVAILTGPDESVLEDIASRVKITAKEEKPVFGDDPVSRNHCFVTREIAAGNETIEKIGELSGEKTVTGVYVTGIQEHLYPEPHGAVAALSTFAATDQDAEEESLMVYTATQWPYHVKRSIAKVLGWDNDRVQVYPTLAEVHLDGKIWYPSLVACHAALAAFISGVPVKLMLTKEEDFLYSPKRNKSEIEIQSVLDEKSGILGSTINLCLDLGAQGIFADEIMDRTCLGTLGLYRRQSFVINGIGKNTNIPPQGPMAGFGLSQGCFAAERHISRIADTLGKDPAEWRKANFLKKDQSLATGTVLKGSVPLPELIDAAADMSDYYRKWASYELLRNSRKHKKWEPGFEPLRGIGISTAFQGNGFLYNEPESGNGNCTVEMTLEKEGSLEIKTCLVSSGTGFPSVWQDMIRDILGIEPDLIRLTNNTKKSPDSGPGTLSRNISAITATMVKCCQLIKKQRVKTPLPITVKRTAKPGKEPGWLQGKTINPESFSSPSWGAAVAEVEIDPVSISPVIRGIWLVVDGGKILSQGRARRTLSTGIIQALGWTCRERLHYEAGKIPPETYHEYDICAPEEVPPIYVDFIWNNMASPKGIGDLPFCCVPAAYVQAVSQAMDHPFERIPLGAQDIWDAVMLKQTETPQ